MRCPCAQSNDDRAKTHACKLVRHTYIHATLKSSWAPHKNSYTAMQTPAPARATLPSTIDAQRYTRVTLPAAARPSADGSFESPGARSGT